MKKYIRAAAVILAVILTGTFLLWRTEDYHVTLPSYAIHRDAPQQVRQVQVTFDGRVTRHLFRPDTFRGCVDVQPLEWCGVDFRPDDLEETEFGINGFIAYIGSGRIHSSGYLYATEDGFILNVLVPDGYNSASGKVYVTWPEPLSWEEIQNRLPETN